MAENKGILGGLLGGVVGGIAGLGQGFIQRQTDRLNANRNFQQNMQMSQYQYSKDLEMWNRANEYNSPSAQMARYQSAGLNPNLIYGTGSGSAGNTATSLPKYQAPTYQQNYHPPIDIAQVIGMYQDFRLRQAQIDSVKEDARRKSWENFYNFTGVADVIGPDGKLEKGRLPMYGFRYRLAESQSQIKDAEAQIAYKMYASKMNAIDLQNEIREKTRNWFVANQLSNMVAKALGGLGVSKLAGNLRRAPQMIPYKGYKNPYK